MPEERTQGRGRTPPATIGGSSGSSSQRSNVIVDNIPSNSVWVVPLPSVADRAVLVDQDPLWCFHIENYDSGHVLARPY